MQDNGETMAASIRPSTDAPLTASSPARRDGVEEARLVAADTCLIACRALPRDINASSLREPTSIMTAIKTESDFLITKCGTDTRFGES